MARSANQLDFHEAATNGAAVESLDRRLHRLESAVAAMQDVQIMEDRVVERVVLRIEKSPDALLQNRAGVIVDPARMLPPHLDLANVPNADGADVERGSWIFVRVYREVRAMMRTFADHRYTMTWSARTVLISAFVIVVLSWLLISGLPFVGWLLDRIILVVAAIVAYRTMSGEVQRHQESMSRTRRFR